MTYEETIENAKIIEDLQKLRHLLNFVRNSNKVTITYHNHCGTKSISFYNKIIFQSIVDTLEETYKNLTKKLDDAGIKLDG